MKEAKLLIILSPPRSFSSVISTVIGEHPQLYGFPELHLFVGDTVQDMIDLENRRAGRYAGSPGVLRTLAQLHDGRQTTETIVRAKEWLYQRRDWTAKKLIDYLLEKIMPQIGVEKSPVTVSRKKYLERAYSSYPNAYYLHLTRHPISTRKSMEEFHKNKQLKKSNKRSGNSFINDRLVVWYQLHKNIIDFTNSLPVGQSIRIKGEDILSEPDVYLSQLCDWLGIRSDKEAVEAMKHPETSPYACIGPYPAYGGNDPKFMANPSLRIGRVREPSLSDFLAQETLDWFADDFKNLLEPNSLSMSSLDNRLQEITHLAGVMGYK